MSLNVELLRKVRDAIADEANPVGFDMSSFGEQRSCGTTACIAGHAAMIGGRGRWQWDHLGNMVARKRLWAIENLAAELLGLTTETDEDDYEVYGPDIDADAERLFYGEWANGEPHALHLITRAKAVAYLDRCLAAGEIVR
jgi:hypothetical protein